jgi:hypothetical protein
MIACGAGSHPADGIRRAAVANRLPTAAQIANLPHIASAYNVVLSVPIPEVAARLLLAVCFFFALDGPAFRTGWYADKLKPDSTAGFLQTYLWIEE